MKSSVLQRVPLPVQLILYLALVLSLLWSVIFLDLHRLHQQALSGSRASVDNLARAFAEEVNSSINAIDLTLIELREEWQSGYNDFSHVVERRQTYLEKDVGFQVAILNATGQLVFLSTKSDGVPTNYSDREHFKVHEGLAMGDRLFISKPVLGRASRRWTIQFTRPLIDANGAFAGVIVLSVSPDYFSRFYRTIDLGRDGSITLARESGEVLTQSPDTRNGAGRQLRGLPFLFSPGGVNGGWFEGSNGADEVKRLYGWRRIPSREMVVMVGQSLDTVFAQYQQQRDAYFLTGAGISLVLAAIGYFLLAGLRQRAQATALLVESEARWQFALEGAAEGVWDWNIPGGEVQFSRRWKEILGYRESEVDGGVAAWQERIHPEDRPAALRELQAHLAGANTAYNSEHRARCRDGSWKWVLERGMVVSMEDGKPLRMVGTLSDISRRKEAERQDEQRRRALEDTRRALQQAQKLEALGRLTGGIAHDFNNILQTLSTGITFALMSNRDAQPRTALEACQRAVERGVELTRQLLVFGRVQDAHLKTVDCACQIRDMRSLLQGALPSNIAFAIDLPDSLWPVRIDPLQFELAMLNLTMNARDAMPQGGSLNLVLRNAVVGGGVGALEPGDYLHITLTDTGGGMSEEVLAKALDPFFTTKAVGKGSGMGLAQAYAFARQMDGELLLRNADGGLEVSIYLPRASQEAGLPAPQIAAPTASLRASGRLLLVEDDALVRQTVQPALQQAGFEVEVAHDAAQAMQLLERRQDIDLVFSDIVMPGEMSGIDLAEFVRQHYPTVRVLLATGYSEHRVDSTDIRILAKPYGIDALIAAIGEELGAGAVALTQG
ncbi:PAS domain-containing protein [Noviherbaspirillum pedocola]|uniref:histidine kinase n=1 Tax=Noviherbaspirillum pedocola TaxID=2801341 RepID=A0A934SY18_9BURK|nr:PAS domain-containing protein [Noviherbaspirillum pedocola]MBK4737136.1 PAS domain-containing protein [Noviherbaspirillum pedocola]